jgi:hypothetical protein
MLLCYSAVILSSSLGVKKASKPSVNISRSGLGRGREEEEEDEDERTVRNFPCQTLKIRNVFLVVMGS